jgi:hypothetical protein
MTDVDRISAKFASMNNADKAPPVRGASVNGGGAPLSSPGWTDNAAAGALKPHAQVKLLSPTEKCKVRERPPGCKTNLQCRSLAFFFYYICMRPQQ